MTLRALLLDRQRLMEHGSMNQPLEECLRAVKNQGLEIVDTGTFPEADHRKEICMDVMKERLGKLGLSFRDCLMIADCEESVRQAKSWGTAVLGYEPNGLCRISSHLDMLIQGFDEIDLTFLVCVYRRFFGLPWDILETERCLVREMTLQDLPALYELYHSRSVTRYLEDLEEDRQTEETKLNAHINCMYRFYGYGMWAVVEKATGQLIGRAGFGHLSAKEEPRSEFEQRTVENGPMPELGYLIAADKQRRGYAAEVCRAILDYGWRKLGFSTVYCMIREENRASIRLAEKLGFVREQLVEENGTKLLRYKTERQNNLQN